MFFAQLFSDISNIFFCNIKKNTILKNSKKDKILEEIFREDLKNIDYSKSDKEV